MVFTTLMGLFFFCYAMEVTSKYYNRIFGSPIVFPHEVDNKLIALDQMGLLLPFDYLIEFKILINNTIKYYKKNKFDNDKIRQDFDNAIIEQRHLQSNIKVNNEQIKKEKIDTNVYLIKDCKTKYIKIGLAKNPTIRIKDLTKEKQNCSPEKVELKLLCCFPCNQKYEKILHEKFMKKNIQGEWFDLNNNDINYIKRYFKKIVKV